MGHSAFSFDAPVFPHHADRVPPGTIDAGDHQLRSAWNQGDLDAVQALRHRGFQQELGEGVVDVDGERDRDERDPWFHHLMLCHRPTGAVVGTCRLQTAVMAATRFGKVLRLLWRGLARYLQWNDKRFLFGCCSLPGTDSATASEAWRILHARRAMHDRFVVRPRPEVRALEHDRARPLIDAEALYMACP